MLLGIVLLGAILRFWGLGAQSIWLDETHSIDTAIRDTGSVARVAASGQHAPPLLLRSSFLGTPFRHRRGGITLTLGAFWGVINTICLLSWQQLIR